MHRYTNWTGSAGIAIGSILCLVLTLAACTENETPTSLEPSEMLMLTKQQAATAGQGAVVETGTAVLEAEGLAKWPCVDDEDVYIVLYAPYDYHMVLTPTGNFVYHDHWKTKEIIYTLVGQTSGTVWHGENIVTQGIQRSTGGELTHYTFKGTFVSDTGPDIYGREVLHMSRNAAGELTADFYRVQCRFR